MMNSPLDFEGLLAELDDEEAPAKAN
jgi:hypothetical protein